MFCKKELHMKKLTIFAMTEKGYAVVTSIFAAYPEIIDAVVATGDKSIAKDYFVEIADFCSKNNIPFYNRTEFHSIRTEYAIAVSWRWIVKDGPSRLIIFHDSLLPCYRGFNPLVTALINGDTKIGVTALYATAEYDRGEIISQSTSTISYPIRIEDAIRTILVNYKDLAIKIADDLFHDKEPVGTPQYEPEASYSLWRDEEDYFIDWTKPAETIKRTVDALGFPYMGAASTIEGEIVRVLKAKVLDDVSISNRTCGKVIFVQDSKPVVVCGKGLLRIDELVDNTGNPLIPLTRFRIRFKGFAELITPTDAVMPRG